MKCSRDELRNMMIDFAANSRKITDQEVDEALTEADVNKDGQINFYEFVGVIMKPDEANNNDEEVKRAFELFDQDKNGTVDKFELYYAMKLLGKPLSKQDVENLFENFDLNKDGELNFEEFKKIIHVADAL